MATPNPEGWKLVAQAAERRRAREIWAELDEQGHFNENFVVLGTIGGSFGPDPEQASKQRHPSGRRIRTRRGQQ